jgi:hypothetical protein
VTGPQCGAATSPQALVNYLRGFDTGASAETMHGDPSIGGRFFYNEDLSGLNFERSSMPLARSLERLLEMLGESAPPALYVGALAAPAALPGFAQQNTFALAEEHRAAAVAQQSLSRCRRTTDLSYNLACVVGGRRRFTLFPPEQNRKPVRRPTRIHARGPAHQHGAARCARPRAFPALPRCARTGPGRRNGTGRFVVHPVHVVAHVEALDTFNLLVNYWWDDTPPWNGSPFEALFHALMSVHSLPPDKRAIWKKVFEHHVFETDGSATEHLPPAKRGIQGTLDKQLALHMRSWLLRALTPRRR